MSSVALPGLWTPELWTPDKGWVPKLGSLKRFNRRIWERAKDETIVEAVSAANSASVGVASYGASQTLTITAPSASNTLVVFVWGRTVSTLTWSITPQGTQAFTNLFNDANGQLVNGAAWVSTNPGTSTSIVVVPPVTAMAGVMMCMEFAGASSALDAARLFTFSTTAVASKTSGTYTPTQSDLLLGFVAESVASCTVGTSSTGWTAGPNTISAAGGYTSAMWWKQDSAAQAFVATFSPSSADGVWMLGLKTPVAVSEPRIPLGNQAVMRAANR